MSFDTLRADHLGAYGYHRDTSPFFDELAAESGTLFEQAWVQFPSTLTSHMSMLTGLYPAQHGVFPPAGRLDDAAVTLAERLQAAGYRTAAHTEGGYMHGRFGFRQGFEEFKAKDRRGPEEIEYTFGRGVWFLERLAPEDRFFLFLHTYCVHATYDPPEEYRGLFWEGPPPEGAFPPTGPRLADHNLSGEPLPAEVARYFEALYDETIRYADDRLRALFADLERLGLADDTLVIVTSDHGEEFQEHGLMNHEQLYPEVMRVPLLVVHPRVAGGVRHEPVVQEIDLVPTILELAGVEGSPELPGKSLARVLGADVPAVASEAYGEAPFGRRTLVRHDGERLWQVLVEDPPDDWWFSRRATLSLPAGRVELRARTAGEDRPLRVTRDGAEVATFGLSPEWARLTIDVPAGQGPVELTVPSCHQPDEPSRCLGFQLAGVPLARAELYALGEDPAAQQDRAAAERRRTRELLDRLGGYRWEVSAGRQEALDPETESALKALGYLQ